MASSVQQLEASFTPQVAEVVAILRGIEFATDLGLVPIVVESDALGVVNTINSYSPNKAEIGIVIDDIVSITFIGWV